ncbi:MAG TPA: hypothetical protein VGM42_03095 [Rhodopila sp.]|jgi:hypothetical protein
MADQVSDNIVPASEIIKVLTEHEKENNAFIRHYEDVRFKITQINVTLSVLLVGASRFGNLHASKILLSVFIMVLGIHGILVCAKYTERADRHAVISRAYRRALSDFVGRFNQTSLEEMHQRASKEHASSRGVAEIFVKIQARWFWVAIHAAVVILGVFVAFT